MIRILKLLILCISIAACGDNDVGISISGVNFTDKFISDFSVNGYSGANISINGGGGSFVCCVSIPKHWRPGLNVTVRWYDDEENPEVFKEKIVQVPEYGPNDFGAFVVHFYPDDTVKVLVTSKFIGHPQYPFPRPSRE